MKARFTALHVMTGLLMWAATGWASTPVYKAPIPTQRTLENGLRVVVFQDDRLPVARVQLLVPAGISAQGPDEQGLAHFTAQMLRRGTATRDAAQLARDLADAGANLSGSARRDFTLFDLGVLSEDLGRGLELLSDVVRNPTFSADEIGRMRFEVSRTVIELHLNVVSTAEEQIWPLAMGAHPYGQVPAGEVPALVTIDRERLEAYHERYYKPGGSVLVVAGGVSMDIVLKAAQSAFGEWSGRAENVPIVAVGAAAASSRVRIVDLPSRGRTEIRIAFHAPAHGSSDYTSFRALDQVLGRGVGSRLDVAQLPGVFGSARSSYTALRDGGLLIISAPVHTDSVDTAVAAMKDVIESLRTRPPGEAEVEEVKRVMRNTYPLNMETLGSLITQWSTADHYGLGEEAVSLFAEETDAVTPGDLVRLATEWLVWDRASVLAVGPASEVEARLATFGSVEVTQLSDSPQAAWASTAPTEEDFEKGRALAIQAIAAHGGKEALAAVNESSVDGVLTVVIEGKEAKGRLRQARKDPAQFRELLELFVYSSEHVLNGDRGWVYESSAGRVDIADSRQAASMRANFESDVVHLLRFLGDEETQVAHRGHETVQGRPAELLQVLTAGHTRWLLFDEETHLIIAMDVRGGVPPQILGRRVFADYREVNGVMWPYLEERFDTRTRTMRIEAQEVVFNPGFAGDLFSAPDPPH